MNPACFNQRAYDGGVWNAKQFVLPEPHFDRPPDESVPSRFPSTTSPARSVLTSEKNALPPSEGRFGVEPMTMSPVATMATTPGGTVDAGRLGACGFGFGAGFSTIPRSGPPAVAGFGPPSTSSENTNALAATTAPARTISATTRTER